MAVNLSPVGGVAGQFFDNNGNPLTGGKLYTYAAGTTTPQATYTSAAGTTAHTNPIILDAAGRVPSGEIWLTDSVSYKFVLKNPSDVLIASWDNVDGISGSSALQAFKTALASSSGSTLVGYSSGQSGSVAATVQSKLRESLNAVNDFACDNTGVTNTTNQLLAFYNACINSGKSGHIPAGSYKVTPGVLKFYSGGVDKLWPNITTDGHYAVFFDVDGTGNINAPIIEITTVTANSANHPSILSKYWLGGSHGGLTFRDNTGQTADQRHGLALTGVWYTNFGVISGFGLRASTVYQPQNMIGGVNPDPWSCFLLTFDAILGQNNVGRTVTSENGVGLDSWVVKFVYCIDNASGGWYGAGTGTVIEQMAGSGVDGGLGWFFDDGAASGSPFGGNRVTIGVVECDGWQQGFRINKLTDFEFRMFRFNHRYSAATGQYWPRVCFQITAGTDPNVRTGQITAYNRIESGGTFAQLGNFMQCNNSSSIFNLDMDVDYADNGGLGVTDAWVTQNSLMSTAMSIRVTKQTKVLWDSFNKGLSDAIGSAAATLVPNTGWATSAAKLTFSAAQAAPSLSTQYDLATSTYTAPYTGLYQVQMVLPMTCAVGTRIRMGFFTTLQGVECAVWSYQVNAGNQMHSNTGQVYLRQGDTVYAIADQNTASATLAVTPQSNANECRFVVIPL